MSKSAANAIKVLIVLIVVVAILAGVFFIRSYTSEANELADIVNRGNAMMDACYYDEAIECYEQAMEKMQGDERLTSAIVLAYMQKAQMLGDSDDAINAYKAALSYQSDIKSAYWSIADIYEGRGEEDMMMDVLREGYAATNDESMDSKVAGIENERARIAAEEEAARLEEEERLAEEQAHSEMLEALIPVFEAGNPDDIKTKLREEAYVTFSEEVIGDTSYYYGDKDPAGNREGKGLAVYENGYYYYGDFHGNVRSGHGLWIRAVYSDTVAIGSYMFEGEWQNDCPMGNGTATSSYYKDRIGASELFKQVITGNYTNGLEDGQMSMAGTTKSGTGVKYTYNASLGVAKQSSNDDSGVKGQYIIAKSSDGSTTLTSDGSKRGVEGFIDE